MSNLATQEVFELSNSSRPAQLFVGCAPKAQFPWASTAPPARNAGAGRLTDRAQPRVVTVPLCSRANASPFWIILLRV